MIGQLHLLTELNNLSLETFKTPILLFGAFGCGKHTLVNELAKKFNLELVNIEETVTSDDLIEYQQCPVDKLYLINLTNFTEKQQNKILKFIEEPNNNTYIILIAESEFGLLNTILNRCIKYYFDDYSKAELQEFLTKMGSSAPDIAYNICKTPGQLLSYNLSQLTNLYNLCKKIITGIKTATYANIISIELRVNYKEDYDKYDFILFFNTLLYVAFEEYINTKSEDALKIYLFTNKHAQKIQHSINNKENFMINFLIELKEILN